MFQHSIDQFYEVKKFCILLVLHCACFLYASSLLLLVLLSRIKGSTAYQSNREGNCEGIGPPAAEGLLGAQGPLGAEGFPGAQAATPEGLGTTPEGLPGHWQPLQGDARSLCTHCFERIDYPQRLPGTPPGTQEAYVLIVLKEQTTPRDCQGRLQGRQKLMYSLF